MARRQQSGKAESARSKSGFNIIWILYVLIAISIVAYAAYGSSIFGVSAFFLIIITLVAEFRTSLKEEGLQRSIYEVILALATVVVIWLVAGILLQTTSPLNVVASCSMLPSLHRGDLIILHGISNVSSFLQSNHIHVVNVPQGDFSNMVSNMNSEFLAYYVHSVSNKSVITATTQSTDLPVSLYNTRCLATYSYTGAYRYYGSCAVSNADQRSNLIQYNYSFSKISINGSMSNIVGTSALIIGNHTVMQNYSNPIIVYKTTPNDSFGGDIIHRLYAVIRTGNGYYFLTKGDNNPGIDVQFGNYPIPQPDVVGYVVLDVPFLGYLKLILSGQIASPPGCNYTILR